MAEENQDEVRGELLPAAVGAAIKVRGATDDDIPDGLQAHLCAVSPRHVGYTGTLLDYNRDGLMHWDAWEQLSPSIRSWVEERAGARIDDPFSGEPTVYWHCQVDPEPNSLRGTAASYELVMFGRRALVLSTGWTTDLPSPGESTGWRQRRLDLAVDESGLRNDHRLAAPPNRRGDGGGAQLEHSNEHAGQLLPSWIAAWFGNLPLATQHFLLAPFRLPGRRPVEACVLPSLCSDGRRLIETYTVYHYNAKHLAFARARRSIPKRRSRASDVQALQQQPWDVIAWTAPVL